MSSTSCGGNRFISNRASIIALMLISFLAGCKSESGQDKANSDVERLIAQVRDPQNRMREERQTPLHIAAEDGHTNEVVQLLANGSKVDERKMIERGANINAAEEFGDTVLHFAAGNENPEMVKLLLDAGAKVNPRGRGEYTPLHSAASNEKGAVIVKLLLQAGADVNAKDEEGETPLHHVPFFCCGTTDCARELMSAGADPNAKSENGRTPLHKAAAWGRADIVAVLLDGHAEINAADNEGKTPLDLAIEPERLVTDAKASATVALLKKRGGHRGAQPRAK